MVVQLASLSATEMLARVVEKIASSDDERFSRMRESVFTVHVQYGRILPTGKMCPVCLFESMTATLVIYNTAPQFFWKCARGS
ncbi:hypothetical protein AB0230_02015 [Microbacterium sp. NPDC089190]|uniref:hypothetical protein n=1 Tax=Microbacterium sp. NPDC089190 TaxID=3155063 RepID=UPI00344D8E06